MSQSGPEIITSKENPQSPSTQAVRKTAWVEAILFTFVTYALNFGLLRLFPITLVPAGFRDVFIQFAVLIQMFIPGIVSIFFRLVFRRGFSEIGWKTGRRKFWLQAVLISLSVPILSYFLALLLGKVRFDPGGVSPLLYRDPLSLSTFFYPTSLPNWLGLKILLRSVIVLSYGFFVNFFLAFGEELGWRGYLQPRLIQTGFKYPYVLCGLLWAGWHLPFLWLVFNPATPSYAPILFTINITLLGIISGRLWQNSCSVWIPTLLHAAHNLFNFELFAAVLPCSQCGFFVGENGLLMGLIYALIVRWMVRPPNRKAGQLLPINF